MACIITLMLQERKGRHRDINKVFNNKPVTVPWIPEHVSKHPVHHKWARIGYSTPWSLDILLAYPVHWKKNPRTRWNKSWKSISFRKRGSLGVCICAFPKEPSLLCRWTCHLLPHQQSHQSPQVGCAPSKGGSCTDVWERLEGWLCSDHTTPA